MEPDVMLSDIYKTISLESKGLFKDKGSKFFAFAYPVMNEDEAKFHIKKLKKEYHDARHHCFAYKLGPDNLIYRMNDDGEPSGTAGKPIYGRIEFHDLTNILIVVVRYFGGILLGTSGLSKAYKSAAEDCIKNATVIERTIDIDFQIFFSYNHIDTILRLVKEETIRIKKQSFENQCKMELSIRRNSFMKVSKLLLALENLKLIEN